MLWHTEDVALRGLVAALTVLLVAALVVAACSGRFKAGEVDLQVDKPSGSSLNSPPQSLPAPPSVPD